MVKDVEQAVKFYRDDLGLRQTVRYGNEWVELEAPGTVIALNPNRKPKSSAPPKTMSIGFQVKDVDGTVVELQERGVKLIIQDNRLLRRADCADADGHRLDLME